MSASKATARPDTANPFRLKIAVLVSGSGSNLQVLIDAMQSGELPIEIVGVISNVKEAYAITRAEQAGIDTAVLSHIASGDNAGKRMGIKTFERHAKAQLDSWQPDLIVLAGFMRVLSGDFIESAPAPMINLHPSLLPNYKGLDTHARVLKSGERLHGCSIHVVTAELDAGQVLTQAMLSVTGNESAESLQAKVQRLEHQLLPWTILLIAYGVIPASVFDQKCLNENDAVSDAFDNGSATSNHVSLHCHLPPLPFKLWSQ